jgi:hypothetical protein
MCHVQGPSGLAEDSDTRRQGQLSPNHLLLIQGIIIIVVQGIFLVVETPTRVDP